MAMLWTGQTQWLSGTWPCQEKHFHFSSEMAGVGDLPWALYKLAGGTLLTALLCWPLYGVTTQHTA